MHVCVDESWDDDSAFQGGDLFVGVLLQEGSRLANVCNLVALDQNRSILKDVAIGIDRDDGRLRVEHDVSLLSFFRLLLEEC